MKTIEKENRKNMSDLLQFTILKMTFSNLLHYPELKRKASELGIGFGLIYECDMIIKELTEEIDNNSAINSLCIRLDSGIQELQTQLGDKK